MRFRKVLIAILVLMGLAVPAALVGIRSAPARHEIRKQLVRLVRAETGMRAELGDLQLRYLPPTITIRQVALVHPTEGLFVRADQVVVTPRLWGLANGRVEIDEVVVEHATVRLVLRDGELKNGPRLRERPSGTSADGPPLRGLTVSDTTLLVESDRFARGRIDGVDLDVSAEDGDVLEARLRAIGGELRHERGVERIGAVELRLALGKRALILRRLDVAIGDVRLRASEGTIARSRPLDTEVRVQLSGPASVAQKLGVTDPVLQGRIAVDARLRVHDEDWSVAGTAHLERPQIDQFLIGDSAELPFQAGPGGVQITGGLVRAAHGEARLPSARLTFDESLTLDAEISLKDIRFAEVLENLTLPNSHCEIHVVSGGSRFHGTLIPFRIDSVGDVVLHGRDVRVTLGGWHQPEPRTNVLLVPSAELRTRVRFDATGARFRQARIGFGRSAITLDAHLRLQGDFEIHGRGERVDLDDIDPLAGFDIGGHGEMRFDIRGAYSDPLVTGHARMAAFRFHTFGFGDVDSDVEYRDLVLSARNGHGVKGRSRFTVVEGALDFRPANLTAHARVQAERLVLSEFYEIWQIQDDPDFRAVQGEAQGSADIRFDGGTLEVGYDANLAGLTVHGEDFDSGTARGRWRWIDRTQGFRGSDIELTELSLRKGQGTIAIDGTTRRGVLDLFAVADRIALADVQHLPPELTGLGAVVGVHFPVRGTLDDLQVQGGRLAVSEIRLGGARLGTSDLRFDITGPIVSVRGEMLGGQVGLALQARRSEGIPYAGRLELRELRLGWLLERLGIPTGTGAEGVATGVVHIERGLLARPESAQGRLTLTTLRLSAADYRLENVEPIRIAFANGAVDLQRASFAGRNTRLELSGSMHGSGALALRLHGEVHLDFLTSLYPQLEEVHGLLSIDASLSGTGRHPVFFGSAHVGGGLIKLRDVDERLEAVSGTIQFSQSRLLLQDFQGRLGTGALRMNGSVRLDGADLAGYALGIGLEDVAVRLDDEGTSSVIDGQLGLRWSRGDRLPVLDGDLDVVRLRYEREIRVADLRQLDRRARRAEVEEIDPADDLVTLAVRLHGSSNLVVQNNLLDAEFRIDETSGPLTLVGTNQRLGLVGQLALTRGTLRFRSNDFEITRGAVTFSDRTKIDPRFDVSAETEIRDWRIELQALGSAEEFRIFTRSQPDLPEEDVFLLLALGVTRDELGDQDTNSGQIGGQAALEALAAVTGVDREVRRVVPIDDIRLGSTYSTTTNRSEPTLSIGKRVTRDVRVSATTRLGETRDVSASAEWQLNRNLSVEVGYGSDEQQQSTLGNLGLDLRFRLEFE